MKIYKNLVMDEERALYGLHGARIEGCRFEGPADGESAIKECSDLIIENCDFLLRYPLWHVTNAALQDCRMTETCRAALWYDQDLKIKDSILGGIKALRECDNCALSGCEIISTEFGWFCRGVRLQDCTLTSEYPFLYSRDLVIDKLKMKGKYSFQCIQNSEIRNCDLDTKDAFWHSRNVTVVDSIIRGEYLGWYSQNLRLIRCKISGTQPLCYCKGLVLEDCEMEACDLSFENSDVKATVRGSIDSVKNPISGFITANSIGQIILDEHLLKTADCKIKID